MTVVLHHLENSRSQRILWLLEELGIEYEVKIYKRQRNKLAPKELRDVHPLGKSPVITDGDLTIAETGVIIDYLVETYGPQFKPDPKDAAKTLQYKYWLHFGEGSAFPPLLFAFVLRTAVMKTPWLFRYFSRKLSDGIQRFYTAPNIERHAQFMEDSLAKNPKNWFVDDLSGADIMLQFVVESTGKALDLSQYPHLKQFLDTVSARPAWKRALEKGKKTA